MIISRNESKILITNMEGIPLFLPDTTPEKKDNSSKTHATHNLSLEFVSQLLSSLFSFGKSYDISIKKVFEFGKISFVNLVSVKKLFELKDVEIDGKKLIWVLISDKKNLNSRKILPLTKEIMEVFGSKLEHYKTVELEGEEEKEFNKHIEKSTVDYKISSFKVNPKEILLTDDLIYYPEDIENTTPRLFALGVLTQINVLLFELMNNPRFLENVREVGDQLIASTEKDGKYLLATVNMLKKMEKLAGKLSLDEAKELLKGNNKLENYFLANEVIKYLKEEYSYSKESYGDYLKVLAAANRYKKKDDIYGFEKEFGSIISAPYVATESSAAKIPIDEVFDYIEKNSMKDKESRIKAIFQSNVLPALIKKLSSSVNPEVLVKNIIINSEFIENFRETLKSILKKIMESKNADLEKIYKMIAGNLKDESVKELIEEKKVKNYKELYFALANAVNGFVIKGDGGVILDEKNKYAEFIEKDVDGKLYYGRDIQLVVKGFKDVKNYIGKINTAIFSINLKKIVLNKEYEKLIYSSLNLFRILLTDKENAMMIECDKNMAVRNDDLRNKEFRKIIKEEESDESKIPKGATKFIDAVEFAELIGDKNLKSELIIDSESARINRLVGSTVNEIVKGK